MIKKIIYGLSLIICVSGFGYGFACNNTNIVSAEDTATSQPIVMDQYDEWHKANDKSLLITSGQYSYRIIDDNKKEIELRKIASNESEIAVPSTIDGYKVVSLGYSGDWRNDLNIDAMAVLDNPSYLKKITIPDSVTNIGCSAFNACINLNNLNLPDSLTYIRNGAFAGCKKLKELHLNDGIRLDSSAFAGCKLNKVYSKGFDSVLSNYEEGIFNDSTIDNWYISGEKNYTFKRNNIGEYSTIKNIYVDKNVKKIVIIQSEEKGDHTFIENIYIEGEKTSIEISKNTDSKIYAPKASKAVNSAKKAKITYSYKTKPVICVEVKSDKKNVKWNAKKTYQTTYKYNKNKSKWENSVKKIKTSYVVYGKNKKSASYKQIKITDKCKVKIPYIYVKVMTA